MAACRPAEPGGAEPQHMASMVPVLALRRWRSCSWVATAWLAPKYAARQRGAIRSPIWEGWTLRHDAPVTCHDPAVSPSEELHSHEADSAHKQARHSQSVQGRGHFRLGEHRKKPATGHRHPNDAADEHRSADQQQSLHRPFPLSLRSGWCGGTQPRGSASAFPPQMISIRAARSDLRRRQHRQRKS